MQKERVSLCGLPYHTKLIILKIPLNNSYKSTRRPSIPISSQNSFFRILNGTKNFQIGKCDIKLGPIFGQ